MYKERGIPKQNKKNHTVVADDTCPISSLTRMTKSILPAFTTQSLFYHVFAAFRLGFRSCHLNTCRYADG